MVNYIKEMKLKSLFLIAAFSWEMEFGRVLDFKSKLVFIDEHLDRIFNSANGISLHIPLTKNEIIDEIEKVLSKNDMIDDVHIRLIISRGNKITPYQNPNANVGPINFVIIPEYKKTNHQIYLNGIRIGRVQTIRPPENILSTHYNTLNKLNCILASIEANELNYDEGIMNDPNGNISTCNSTNLFVKNKQVWTSTGKYCLNGITRNKAILLSKMNEIICHETILLSRILKTAKKLLLLELLLVLFLFLK